MRGYTKSGRPRRVVCKKRQTPARAVLKTTVQPMFSRRRSPSMRYPIRGCPLATASGAALNPRSPGPRQRRGRLLGTLVGLIL
jgi:hypothetical protein